MADFRINDKLAARVSGIAKARDGYVDLLDYGVTHPDDERPGEQCARRGYPDGRHAGRPVASSPAASRCAGSRSTRVEVNLSGDYTHERSEPQPTVLLAAGLPQSATNPVFAIGSTRRRQRVPGSTAPARASRPGCAATTAARFRSTAASCPRARTAATR